MRPWLRRRFLAVAAAVSLAGALSAGFIPSADAMHGGPHVFANARYDSVNGFGASPSSTVTVEMFADASDITADFSSGSVPTDGGGNYWTNVPGLTTGNVVKVTDNTTSAAATLTLAELSITSIDAVTNVVSGTAVSGAVVYVNVNTPPDPPTGPPATADTSGGTWSVDFDTDVSPSVDIGPTSFAQAFAPDAEGDATVASAQPPVISVVPQWDGVNGNGWNPSTALTIDVFTSASDATADWSGPVLTDPMGNFWTNLPVDLVVGNVVRVTDPSVSLSKDVEIVPLSITSVNAATDIVTGTSANGAEVQVRVFNPPSSRSPDVAPDTTTGSWTASLGPFDITGVSQAEAWIADADGDRTNAFRSPATFGLDLTFEYVYGNGFAPDASVQVDIPTLSFTASFPTSSLGEFEGELSPDGDIDVVADHEITVSDGIVTKVLVAAGLTVDVPDPATDVVSGLAPSGAEVSASVDDGERLTDVASGGGAWSIDFTTAHDITNESYAYAWVTDDDGDRTHVTRHPPRLRVEIDLESANGRGFDPYSTVTVDIRSGPGVNPPLFHDAAVPVNGGGELSVDQWQHNLDLRPGMEIMVSGGSPLLTRVLRLATLTVDPIDPATDVVAGTTDPGAQVDVHAFDPTGEASALPVADSKGAWSHDFTGTIDLLGGWHGSEVGFGVPDADGDQTGIDERRPAFIDGDLPFDLVCAEGFDPNGVTMTIDRATGRRLWHGTTPHCVGRDVHGLDIVPGMHVTVSDGIITKDVVLGLIAISSVDADTGEVAGTASPFETVVVSRGGPVDEALRVEADGSGVWSTTVSLQQPNEAVFAAVPDPDGDQSRTSRQAPFVEADLTLDVVDGCGFALDASVTVSIDAFTSTPIATDSLGCFDFDATAQNLTAGKVVTVSDGPITKAVTLVALTMHVDLDTGIVTGTAAAGEDVFVGFSVVDEERGDGMTVTADGTGYWEADFGNDLGPGIDMRASVSDVDHDSTVVAWRADVRFGTPSYTAAESAGSVTVTLHRIGTAHTTVGVSYATSDGSATAPADYTTSSGVLTFADGVTSQTFTVPIVNDSSPESDEVVNLTLSNPTGGAQLDAPLTATITIEDDDAVPPTFAFSSATYSIGEGGVRATVTVERSGNLAAASVAYANSGGTATAGADYVATSGSLSFAAGQTVKTFDVRLLDDGLYEGAETVSLTLSSPSPGALLGIPSAATLTIVDNELPPTVQFAQTTSSYSESSGTAVLVVTRVGPIGSGITVDYVLVTGTATPGADYSFTPGMLVFGKNDTSKTVTVPIFNDSANEADETFAVHLQNPTGATLGANTDTTVVIRASDVQPDVMVGPSLGGPFYTNNVYNTTAAGQTYGTGAARGSKVTLWFRVQNDGLGTATIFVQGSTSKSTLRYYFATTGSDITSIVQAGAYQVTLPAGGAVLIRAELTIDPRTRVGSALDVSVTARFTSDTLLQDVARGSVTVF